ncbi:MAG: hypothetical protein DCC44_10495 [Acidobacteria bacterium]|nr:MAG: hypothetical protein DCC44_10495 [Acidobacteriota bacterium]
MDYLTETTYDTASAQKTPHRAVSAPAIDTSATAKVLTDRLAEAKAELADAIDAGDLERMNEARSLIKSLPEQITLATIRELRERLDEIELELQKNDEKRKLIRDVVVKCKVELHEKEKELQPYYERYNKIGWEQSFAENERESLLQERRERRAKLFALSDQLKNEN